MGLWESVGGRSMGKEGKGDGEDEEEDEGDDDKGEME